MSVDLDVIDTQLLVYMANEAQPWATEIHDEILAGERIVFIPRYVATEFYQVMERNRGSAGQDLAWDHLITLSDTPAAVVPHPNRFRINVDEVRHHATTRALAARCDMQPKDAPILATAYRLAEFIDAYDPPNHSQDAIPNDPEEFRVKRLINEIDVDSITSRILTNERDFVGVDLDSVGLEKVSIERIP
jgi:predicted nucleic acid-binding protein